MAPNKNVQGPLLTNVYQCSYCFNYGDSENGPFMGCNVYLISLHFDFMGKDRSSWICGFDIIVFIDFDYAF